MKAKSAALMVMALAASAMGASLGAGPSAAASAPGSLAGIGASNCHAFPADSVWHARVDRLPVNHNSAAWMSAMGASSRRLHPDFGPSGDPKAPYGIPFIVVSGSHPVHPVSFQYASESDRVGYPFDTATPIEGGASASGDRHAIMINASTCKLYELYDAHASAHSTAGSGAGWSLGSNQLRPSGWTSADAAGLPIFPGLLRLDEVRRGVVDHAIRFTAPRTARSFVWPARHQAGTTGTGLPPLGARFRLKAGYALSGYGVQTKVVLTAMKQYGIILADNGSAFYFQGAASNSWPDALISELKRVPASAFEAVDESKLQVSANSGAARAQ